MQCKSHTTQLFLVRNSGVRFIRRRTIGRHAVPSAATRPTEAEKAANVAYQAKVFNNPSQVNILAQPQPEHVLKRLREIVSSVPNLGQGSRVLDVGAGTGVLLPLLQERGVTDILATEVAEKQLEVIRSRHPSNRLGNQKCVQTWLGTVDSIPAYQGPFDAAFFNSVFGNIVDQREVLLLAALQLKPGGHIVLSHPLGSKWLAGLRKKEPKMVPNSLPSRNALAELIQDLPLEIASFKDEEKLYCAVLRIPEGYSFGRAPVFVQEEVVTGFGRGSKQMGVPTANLKPDKLFAGPLDGLPLGVYFGWAQLQGAEGIDGQVHKTVLNIGKRPSIEDGEQRTVELHILHKFSQDFYGKNLKAVLLGYIRPEMKFDGLDGLIDRIKADTGLARKQLDLEVHVKYAADKHFQQ